MAKTLLVVDDAINVRTMIKDYLTEEGFIVWTAVNGLDALEIARRNPPDLILLDIMMPEMGGYDFIRSYRKEADTPIILLTAKVEETDKVVGLGLGADDYITKPFGMRELVARIQAVMRRSQGVSTLPAVLRFEELVIDQDRHTVEVDGRKIELTPTEFKLLTILIQAPGKVFARAQLLRQLQGFALEGVERTIDVHIRNLRSKIEPDASAPYYVETVFGIGYRFRAE